MKSSSVWIVLFALLIATPLGAAKADPEELTAKQVIADAEVRGALAVIDAWIEAVRTYDGVPGLSVGIVRDQDLIWSQGYGVSNLESGRAADADTIYSICSISKLFTSVAVMQLRDRGELRLDDPVGEHLDWFDIQESHKGSGAATIESLLTHSSGLPRESDFGYWSGEFPFPTREQMIERLGAQKTLYPTQQRFQYSNLALSLAGEIVQARAGKSYEEYVQDSILEPLQLTDTRPAYPKELRGEQLAIGYTGFGRERLREPVEPFFTRGITPAAGFTSSVNDLARFASWQFRLLEGGGREVLNANTLREMHRVHWVDPDWDTTWGIGFNVRRAGDMTLVGHGGGCPGYITQFTMLPKQKLAVIVLTNAGDGPAGQTASGVLKTIAPVLASLKQPAAAEDTKKLPDFSRYEGSFESHPWGGERAIRQWGDQLASVELPAANLDNVVKLKHVEGNNFVRLTDEGEPREAWIFEMGPDGRAAKLLVHGTPSVRIE